MESGDATKVNIAVHGLQQKYVAAGKTVVASSRHDDPAKADAAPARIAGLMSSYDPSAYVIDFMKLSPQ
jgi:hypothetical protein